MKEQYLMGSSEKSERTVTQLLGRNDRKYGDKAAFLFDGETYTWSQVNIDSDDAAEFLLDKGLKKGDIAAFWSVNCYRLVAYLLGAMKTGIIPAVINYSYKSFELKKVLNKTGAGTLFIGESKTGTDYRGIAESVKAECPALEDIYDMVLPEVRNLNKCKSVSLDDPVKPSDTACIVFTSGTTSVPKPVMLTHDNIIFNAEAFTGRMKEDPGSDVIIAPLPLFHSSGITGMLFHSIVTGVPSVIHRRFNAQEVLGDIERYRGSVLMAVPSMLEMLSETQNCERRDISSLRVLQSSGASISAERLRELLKNLGLKHAVMGYGQTECSPLVTTALYEDDLMTATGSAGTPLDGVKIRIWNVERNIEAKTGETGEIQVRGKNVMPGYYNSPEENKTKFTTDGWLKTSDLGKLDEDGRLHFVSRISDLIIWNGENISPAEIEEVVAEFSPKILQVKVVGVPEPVIQEAVACLIGTEGEYIRPDELKKFIKSRLAGYKVPKYVFQFDKLPMTETGKADTAACKSLARELSRKIQEEVK